MAQKLTTEAAEAEATRLLQMALVMLDAAESFYASAYVAHALDILNAKPEAARGDDAETSDNVFDIRPTWGNLVDR